MFNKCGLKENEKKFTFRNGMFFKKEKRKLSGSSTMVHGARWDKLSGGLSMVNGLGIRQGIQTSIRSSAGTVGLYSRDMCRPEKSKLTTHIARDM